MTSSEPLSSLLSHLSSLLLFLLSFHIFRPPGDVPAEDPDHGTVLRLHAGPQAGRLPVDLAGHPDGWSGSGAGGAPLQAVC